MNCHCQTARHGLNYLGDDNVDALIQETLSIARAMFPEQTAKAEAWAMQRLTAYGINYAQYKAQQGYGALTDLFNNPWIVLGGGLLLGYLAFKR